MTAAGTARHRAQRARRMREVVTPEGIALPFTVASRAARAGALIIDFIILFVTAIAMAPTIIATACAAATRPNDQMMSTIRASPNPAVGPTIVK